MHIYDCRTEVQSGVTHATDALHAGHLAVFPTDTVYAVGANAFDAQAVNALLTAKRRGADKPASVLVADLATAEALLQFLPADGRRLIEAFWPGALSLVLPAASSLAWRLGHIQGTVMVRMPDHPVALALLRSAGPIAQSSANLTGRSPATTFEQARDQLGETVHTYLDGGPSGNVPSTIVDLATADAPTILREGAIPSAAIEQALNSPDGHPRTQPVQSRVELYETCAISRSGN